MSVSKKLFYTFTGIANLLGTVLIGFGVCEYVLHTEGWGFYTSLLYIGIGLAPLAICILIFLTNRCCQILYITLLWIGMAIQFAIGYFLITRQNFLALNFANIIDVAWDNELQYPGYMKEYEEMLHCCGRTSPQDYVLIERTPPDICFKDSTPIPENLILIGCRIKVESSFKLILIVSNVLMCLKYGAEILSICSYCCMYMHERSRWRQRY